MNTNRYSYKFISGLPVPAVKKELSTHIAGYR